MYSVCGRYMMFLYMVCACVCDDIGGSGGDGVCVCKNVWCICGICMYSVYVLYVYVVCYLCVVWCGVVCVCVVHVYMVCACVLVKT